jgi:competence protein ComEC
VAHLPGAVGRMHAFGIGPVLLCTAGLLLLSLLRTPLRLSGAPIMLAAVLWAVMTPQPDLLVSADGQTAALRGSDGRLAVLHVGRDNFAVEEWLAADADGRDVHDRGLGQEVACDPSGCIGKLGDGGLVAYVIEPDAFEEDCRRAALVIAVRDDPPPDCAATVVGRNQWRAHGALALRRSGSGFVMDTARVANYDRPWSPAAPQPRPRRNDTTDAGVPTPQYGDIETDQ